MSAAIELIAKTRTDHGKAAVRRMRRLAGSLPAVVYGAGKSPEMLELSHKDMMKSLENEAIYASILDLNVDGKVEKVVLKDLQRHPFKPQLMHVDFLRVNTKEKISMSVPLHFINEESCVGVKAGGMVSHLINDVQVSCLPKDLPEFIAVDVENLDAEHAIHLSEIKLPKGVVLTHAVDEEHDQAVVSVQKPRAQAEEEPTAAPEQAAEVPADKQKSDEE